MYVFRKGFLPNYFRDIFTPAYIYANGSDLLQEIPIRFHISLSPCQGPNI